RSRSDRRRAPDRWWSGSRARLPPRCPGPRSARSRAQLKRTLTEAVLAASTESADVTVTLPVNAAGRVTVADCATAPAAGATGATVTPAAAAAPSTVQFKVRPPGLALTLTVVVRMPAGTVLGAAAIPVIDTGTTTTKPSPRRLAKALSVTLTVKRPGTSPATIVAGVATGPGAPPAVTAIGPLTS